MSKVRTLLVWFLYGFLVLTTLRDRLRCPKCKAVGTYKLHPPCLGNKGQARPFRWLCKWCGYYRCLQCRKIVFGPVCKDSVLGPILFALISGAVGALLCIAVANL